MCTNTARGSPRLRSLAGLVAPALAIAMMSNLNAVPANAPARSGAPQAIATPREDPGAAAVTRLFAAVRAKDDHRVVAAYDQVVAAGKASIAPLLDGLDQRGPAEIVVALRCFRDAGGRLAAHALSAYAAHANDDVRAVAHEIAPIVVGAAFLDACKAGARDKAMVVRRRAYDTLVALGAGSKDLLPLAAEGLTCRDYGVIQNCYGLFRGVPPPARAEAATGIEARLRRGDSSDPVLDAIESVLDRLDDQEVGRAFRFLDERGGAWFDDFVLKSLRRRPAVAAAALDIAGSHRMEAALPVARSHLRSATRVLQDAAISCVSRCGDAASVMDLISLLESKPAPAVTDAVAVALRLITGQFHGFDTAAWRNWAATQDRARRR